jgi:glycosyltransferase involved in cell wall biosynthesis
LIHLPSISTKHLDAISHTFFASVHSLFCKYDIIHYHGIGPAFFSWIPKFFARKSKIVATFHYQDYYHKKWATFARKCLQLGERVTCSIPDKTITVTKPLALIAKEKYKCETIVISNGSDISYSEQIDAISRWSLKDKKYLLFVGKLSKSGGAHYLVEAFKQLEDTSKISNNFKLVIASDRRDADEYIKYLHTISKGRTNIISIGKQTGEPLEQLFSHAYLFIEPSTIKNNSLDLLEAMSYGLTPLVSDTKQNIEITDNNGFTFISKSVTSLRDRLAYLLSKPDEVKEQGILAKKRIQNDFSWDSVATKTIDVYDNLILAKK